MPISKPLIYDDINTRGECRPVRRGERMQSIWRRARKMERVVKMKDGMYEHDAIKGYNMESDDRERERETMRCLTVI